MAEVLQQAVEETSRKALSRSARSAPRTSPTSTSTEDKDEIERVLSGQSDLAFTMSYEALPEIKITDLAALKLEREVADVTAGGDRQGAWRAWPSARSATRSRRTGRPATATGSPSTSSAASTSEEFEGGKGEDVQLVVGPVAASFRASWRASRAPRPARSAPSTPSSPTTTREQKLAGKDAVFDVKVKEVAKPIKPELNDEFAKTLGAEIPRQAARAGRRQDRQRVRRRSRA